MEVKKEKHTREILRILQSNPRPMGSIQVAEELRERGAPINPRMVRNYLRVLDQAGFTINLGRRGRRLTELGRSEVEQGSVFERVGVVASRIDELAYRMTFDLTRRLGNVVLNVSLIEESFIDRAAEILAEVSHAGLGMGRLIALAYPGSVLAEQIVPPGKVAIGTVSAVNFNGVMIKAGIPVSSGFGGLLEYQDGQPRRMVHFIEYAGTTLNPFEVFARGRMTSVLSVVRTGRGVIGATYREVPAAALAEVKPLLRRMEDLGLGGAIMVGAARQPLFEIPLRHGSAGILIPAGLNPAVALQEAGIPVENVPMAGLCEFGKLASLGQQITAILSRAYRSP
jgi:HTH-type transcriptional regulator, global nitrogen regulator NrpRI